MTNPQELKSLDLDKLIAMRMNFPADKPEHRGAQAEMERRSLQASEDLCLAVESVADHLSKIAASLQQQ